MSKGLLVTGVEPRQGKVQRSALWKRMEVLRTQGTGRKQETLLI